MIRTTCTRRSVWFFGASLTHFALVAVSSRGHVRRRKSRYAISLKHKQFRTFVSDKLLDAFAETTLDATCAGADPYMAALERCREKLTDDDEELLELRYVEDLGSRQIADRLQTSPAERVPVIEAHSTLVAGMRANGTGSAGAFRGGPLLSDLAINVDRLLDLAELVCDESASDNEFAELDAFLSAIKSRAVAIGTIAGSTSH